MPDHLTPAQRHLVMSHIRGKGTKPELKVRQWLGVYRTEEENPLPMAAEAMIVNEYGDCGKE